VTAPLCVVRLLVVKLLLGYSLVGSLYRISYSPFRLLS
jgi:hypothetical protein